jgi:hypothetical protein
MFINMDIDYPLFNILEVIAYLEVILYLEVISYRSIYSENYTLKWGRRGSCGFNRISRLDFNYFSYIMVFRFNGM